MSRANNQAVRLVAVVNKQLDSGVAMNALFHMGAGLTNLLGEAGRRELEFIDFVDADGQTYNSISARSFIVLRGTSAEIRRLRGECQESRIPSVSFLATMTGDTYVEQLARTRNTAGSDIVHYGLALFGRKETLDPLTRRFSLWR